MQPWRNGWNAHALAMALAAKASWFKAWNARRTCWFAHVMSATAGIITRNAVTDAVADALLLGTHRMGRSALLAVHPVGGARHRGLAALCHPGRSLGSLDRQACRLPCQARMAPAPGCLACLAGSGLGRRRHPMQVATNSLAARLMRFTMFPANAHVSFLMSSSTVQLNAPISMPVASLFCGVYTTGPLLRDSGRQLAECMCYRRLNFAQECTRVAVHARVVALESTCCEVAHSAEGGRARLFQSRVTVTWRSSTPSPELQVRCRLLRRRRDVNKELRADSQRLELVLLATTWEDCFRDVAKRVFVSQRIPAVHRRLAHAGVSHVTLRSLAGCHEHEAFASKSRVHEERHCIRGISQRGPGCPDER
jgi:hypothetical protein